MKERETEFVISFSVDDIEALLEALYSVDNKDADEYDKYMEQYSVSKPEYDDDDGGGAIYDAIFGNEEEA